MASLYYSNINNIYPDDERLISQLPEAAILKVERFKKPDDKKRSLLSFLLLKKIYGKIDDIQSNSYGKPYFVNAAPFNISHSGDYVLLLVGDKGEVGCDIEQHVDRDITGLAEKILTIREFEYFKKQQDLQKTFYQFWTLKESYMKCVGKGFHLSTSSFTLDLLNGIKLSETTEQNFLECTFYHLDFLKGYTIALCLQGIKQPFPSVEQIDFNA